MSRFVPNALRTLAPVSLVLSFWLGLGGDGWRIIDFLAVRSGASALLHGVSPYDGSRRALLEAHHLVYPPLTGYLFVPFAVLPVRLAIALYLLLSVAAFALALRLLDVGDWRCYAAVALWQPFVIGLVEGTLGALLVLALAMVWRWRERLGVAVVAAAAIVAKLFLWPLLLWLVATKRWRLAVAAVVATAAGLVVPFIGLGTNVAWSYVKLIGNDEKIFSATSFSSEALLRVVGLSASHTHVALVFLAFAAEATIVVLARRVDGDRRSFIVAIAAALLLTPILWSHYLVLLAVPIALRAKAFNVLWLAPIGLWCVGSAGLGNAWELALLLSFVVAVSAASAVGIPDGGFRVIRSRGAWPGVARGVE